MKLEQPPVSATRVFEDPEVFRYFRNEDVMKLARRANHEYWYWTELKHRPLPPGITADMLWAIIKVNRQTNFRELRVGTIAGCRFQYQVTEPTVEKLHRFDLYMGGILQADTLIPADDKNRYLVSSIMEEAIASSQLEGAATTREVAKDMLRKQRKPRNQSERMIYNNYQTIQYILANKNEALTPEMLCQIQARMTLDTLENPEHTGRFRLNDDVRVEDYTTGEVVHIPPAQKDLAALLDWYCAFANEEILGKSASGQGFIHPIVRASILHFLLGYIHPFADGNGRTARAVFYWYLLRKGYWLLEYMSISRIIHQSAAQYAKAYLFTEYDGNDLTYFINYQVKTLDAAFTSLQQYIERKVSEKKQLRDFRHLVGLNERQTGMVQELLSESTAEWTIQEVSHRFNCVYQTARTDLMRLESLGLLEARRVGKAKLVYVRAGAFDEVVARLRQPRRA
ncbi:Fic family protein [Hymenobacter daecheongensis DSM 21074]|uniref:Fic family protein n=1 Tax=Hymenobacter daecheongensis DSM 21074 TaxID=1121955 RepID=A0A1M6IPD4_9BACT|nr:Fic family protein [Hymenobacter daecheongensis]SHJ36324.1 Fic family protein [Hymenobacter daecheongensis DSM 21074]